MSRPEKPIDWKYVDELLEAGCVGTEIAPHFDLHYNTFYDRVQSTFGIGFTEYAAQKKSKGDSILRHVQFNKAKEGDNSMLIWLGKNRLKQSDSPQEIAVSKETLSNFNFLMSQISSLQSASKLACSNNNNDNISALDANDDNACCGSVS